MIPVQISALAWDKWVMDPEPPQAKNKGKEKF